jgi:single-stranded DNA-binding protein
MINIVQVSGYLIREIERQTEEGEITACTTIAVYQKNGKEKDPNADTLLIDLVFRRDLIAFALENLHGGSKLFVDGQMKKVKSKHYVDVKSIHILDCNSQSSSSNGFSISSSSSLDFDETEEDQNLFEESIDSDKEEGVKFKF